MPLIDRAVEDRGNDVLVHRLFEKRAAERPNAPAIAGAGSDVTYQALNRAADAVAARLQETMAVNGPGAEPVVAVSLARGVPLVTAILATLKAGAAYLPLDPALPADRVRALLTAAGARVLLTGGAPQLVSALGGDDRFTVIDVAAAVAAPDRRPRDTAESDRRLAYVIYTSGSTGEPKPVAVEHHSLVQHARMAIETFGLTATDRVLQFANPGFDVLGEELFPTLGSGACVVVVPDPTPSPAELESLIRSQGATVANLPTPYWHQWCDDLDESPRALPPSLRLVIIGSDAGRPGSLAGWRRHSDTPIINAYGLTETTITATGALFSADTPMPTAPVLPVGRPLGDTRAYLLDEAMVSVTGGEVGELFIGGPAVARGYLHRPALTAQRFWPDPFATVPGSRMYRTGDRARLLPDGMIEFLGRADRQVKVRGYRVEPAETEALLLREPGVRECVVVPVGTGEDIRLIAYIVGEADTGALKAIAAAGLPAHQVPFGIVSLAALPMTANGKVDVAALPARFASTAPTAPPEGPVEERVAAIVGEVLGSSTVGRFDDLFDLGANSLHVLRILSRLRNRHGDALTPGDVVRARNVAAIARLIGSDGVVGHLPPVAGRPEAQPVVGPGERRLWFLDQLRPQAGVAYNIASAVRLRGPLDRRALQAAFDDVVMHHERLRTGFVYRDRALRAEINEAPVTRIPIIALARSEAGERVARERVQAFTTAHIDLSSAPLIHGELLRFAADDHLFLMVMHHIVGDGLSLELVERDLAEAYTARRAGEEPKLGHPALRYNDFAHWRAELDASVALTRTLARLDGAPVVLNLPTDHPRPPVMTYQGRRIRRPAPSGLLKAMQDVGRRSAATANGVALTAWGIALARLTGQTDLLIASPTAGRPHPDLEEVVGFFANTVVCRLRIDASATFRDNLTAVYGDMLAALEFEYVAFEGLVAGLAAERDLSRPPLTQTAFAYQGTRRSPTRWGDLEVSAVEVDNGTAKFDLTVEVDEVEGELAVSAEFCTDLFAAETVGGLLDEWLRLLTRAVTTPEALVSDLYK
ncbi:amino acid adenylation domain-containing protein [Micromonospora ureilytica]|uniref:amino acid adenylation domain-containing protein n=1 Tax=Micromonospora ureilytica TaxID=709868 RepID=UPI002E12F069|nr:amino acid adenylation domain-containing protein [Micromonospora ureilytica]